MAAILGSAWEFRQVGPPNKVITLNAYQAPFGRLRKNPVIDTEFELRDSEVFYAGLRTPTRQIFGDKESPIVLHGRWSDKYLGSGGAVALLKEFKQFAADEVQITVKWGQIIAYIGLLHKVRGGIEDSANLAWEMSIKVDEDLDLQKVVPSLDGIPQSVQTSVGDITSDLDSLVFNVMNNPLGDDLLPSFFDQLASLINALRNAEADFYNVTVDLQDYISATNEQLARLLGSLSAMETAVSNIQDAIDTATIDSIVYYRTAEVDYSWIDYKLQNDLAADSLLFELATMDKQVKLAQSGQNQVTVMAQDGDTWETISIKVYGQADGASTLRRANGVVTLRQANGATYGQQPVPGKTYVVPLTALDF